MIAHVGGMPLEETVTLIAPTGAILAAAIGARLGSVREALASRLRRRRLGG